MMTGSIQKAVKAYEYAKELYENKKMEEAFQAYQEAAIHFQSVEDYSRAADCFSRAATCEKIRAGIETAREAAVCCENGAKAAIKAGQILHARWLYREAGLIYEREGDFARFSYCFIQAQHTYTKLLFKIAFKGLFEEKNHEVRRAEFNERAGAFFRWFFGKVSWWIWGYGEIPWRPFATACMIVLGCGLLYFGSGLIETSHNPGRADLAESLYFSGVTFTTLGYGDDTPQGWIRLVAILEAFCGLFIMPLFVISLSRKYLRVFQ